MPTNFYKSLLEQLSNLLVQMGISPTAITPQAHFMRDLGMDSLDSVDLMMRMEHEFGLPITDEQMSSIQTVDQAVRFLEEKLQSTAEVSSMAAIQPSA
jgi:acyl carrier protein